LFEYRNRLMGALVAHDTTILWQCVDSAVSNELSGDRGISDFKTYFRKPNSHFEQTLHRALKLGGSLSTDGKSYFVPSVLSQFPRDIDPYAVVGITGTKVNVRETPSPNGRVLRQLNYDIVRQPNSRIRRDSLGGLWFEIELADSTKGFVSERYVISPVGCRFIFLKTAVGWRLRRWSCGD
jgi:hypothetical protein